MIIGTAGHVDHGKSTLVRALTGIEPDRLDEERERGLTIDLGFAWCTLPGGREVGFVDVPGHERFVKNMLAGAGGIDVALFVVAADEGWMPQSEEHLQILDLLEVERGVVALTRCDLTDADTVELHELDVSERLAGTTLADAPIVRTVADDAVTIRNLEAALDAITNGVADAAAGRAASDRPRLWIDRAFSVHGAGQVVTGTLVGGTFEIGERVRVGPGTARVREIKTHSNRVALNLVGDSNARFGRGQAVTRDGEWEQGRRLQVALRPVRTHGDALTSRGAYHFHLGTENLPARLNLVNASDGLARIYLPRVFGPIAIGDRFVLRDESNDTTAAGGVILDVSGRNLASEDLRRRRRAVEVGELGRCLLDEAGGTIERDSLLRRTGSTEVRGAIDIGRYVADENDAQRRRERLVGLADSGRPVPADPVDRALAESLRRAGEVRVVDGNLAAAGDGRTGSDPAAQTIADVCAERGARPATEAELAAASRLERADALRMVHRLIDAGELVRIGEFVTTRAERDRFAQTITRTIESGQDTMADLRDALVTTRKWAIPILEYFDRTGLTKREGDRRVLAHTQR